jgi:hypothetical protein
MSGVGQFPRKHATGSAILGAHQPRTDGKAAFSERFPGAGARTGADLTKRGSVNLVILQLS